MTLGFHPREEGFNSLTDCIRFQPALAFGVHPWCDDSKMDKTTKYCKRCDQVLPVDLFTKSAARYDGLQTYCQECMKKYRIEHYQNNKQQYKDRNQKQWSSLREYVLEVKNGPCADCNVTYPGEPWLMEFDHRIPESKSGNIFKFVQNGSRKRLDEELAKCDLVCVVCHRRRTAKRGGWVDNRFMLE